MNVNGLEISAEFAEELERLNDRLGVQVMLDRKHSKVVLTGRRASHKELEELSTFNKFYNTKQQKRR
jgi:hypothetical protein